MFDEQPDGDPHGECAAEIERLTKDGQTLRRMLCLLLCGVTAYMDDGEASDSSEDPSIDFLRDSPERIKEAVRQRQSNAFAIDRP